MSIYDAFATPMVNATFGYTYPKKSYEVLNVTCSQPSENTTVVDVAMRAPVEEVKVEVHVDETTQTATSVETPTDERVLPISVTGADGLTPEEIKALKKADLITLAKKLFGEDADVSGTKAEILDRLFKL